MMLIALGMRNQRLLTQSFIDFTILNINITQR